MKQINELITDCEDMKREGYIRKNIKTLLPILRKIKYLHIRKIKKLNKSIVIGRSELLIDFMNYYKTIHGDGNWEDAHVVECYLKSINSRQRPAGLCQVFCG